MRKHLPGQLSWSQVRKLLKDNKVTIGGALCVDEGRRLSNGEVVAIRERPVPPPPTADDVRIVYVDKEIVIASKPSGMITLRRQSEMSWPWSRRQIQPTLDECIPRMIREHAVQRRNSKKVHQHLPKLFPVHRIDRDSSGLLVFARNEAAQTRIIEQFAQHDAVRKYFALVPGQITTQKIESWFIRDRGDGLRGSTKETANAQHAVTHVKTLRTIGEYSELECKLETGRTNQIRIHLAELGNPICGDIKYRGPFEGEQVVDASRVPRMALHAAQLKFIHPETNKPMDFDTPWPEKMQLYLNRLTARSSRKGNS